VNAWAREQHFVNALSTKTNVRSILGLLLDVIAIKSDSFMRS